MQKTKNLIYLANNIKVVAALFSSRFICKMSHSSDHILDTKWNNDLWTWLSHSLSGKETTGSQLMPTQIFMLITGLSSPVWRTKGQGTMTRSNMTDSWEGEWDQQASWAEADLHLWPFYLCGWTTSSEVHQLNFHKTVSTAIGLRAWWVMPPHTDWRIILEQLENWKHMSSQPTNN